LVSGRPPLAANRLEPANSVPDPDARRHAHHSAGKSCLPDWIDQRCPPLQQVHGRPEAHCARTVRDRALHTGRGSGILSMWPMMAGIQAQGPHAIDIRNLHNTVIDRAHRGRSADRPTRLMSRSIRTRPQIPAAIAPDHRAEARCGGAMTAQHGNGHRRSTASGLEFCVSVRSISRYTEIWFMVGKGTEKSRRYFLKDSGPA